MADCSRIIYPAGRTVLTDKLRDLGIQPEYELVQRKMNSEADRLATQALNGFRLQQRKSYKAIDMIIKFKHKKVPSYETNITRHFLYYIVNLSFYSFQNTFMGLF